MGSTHVSSAVPCVYICVLSAWCSYSGRLVGRIHARVVYSGHASSAAFCVAIGRLRAWCVAIWRHNGWYTCSRAGTHVSSVALCVYYIIYTIYYILYSIYYILYTIYYIL